MERRESFLLTTVVDVIIWFKCDVSVTIDAYSERL